MTIELEFDPWVEARFVVTALPASLLLELGERKQDLWDAVGPKHSYGAEGYCRITADGISYGVWIREAWPYRGENGEEVRVLRVIRIAVQ